jgi:hypothetical protein
MDDARAIEKLMPEEFSNGWYRQRLNAVEVLTGRLLATLVEELGKATHQLNAVRKEVNELRQKEERNCAKIGELMGLLEEQNETIEKARAYVQKREQKEVAA